MQQLANDTAGLLDASENTKSRCYGIFSRFVYSSGIYNLAHPEKVNNLILVASTCGGKDGIPPPPEFIKLNNEVAK